MRKLIVAFVVLVALSGAANATCQGGANGTAQLPSSLLTNEFPDNGQPGGITPGCFRDIIATFSVGRVVTVAGAITAATTDHVIEVNKTVGAATTVNMPSCASNAGLVYIIIDGKGDAATNNITLTPTAGNINGATTMLMQINRQTETIWYDGSQCVAYP